MTSDSTRNGLYLVAGLAGLMWAVEIVDLVAGDLDAYGIRPRDAEGLVGVLTAPVLHAGFGHLIGNTIPFLALGATIALAGLARVAAVTLIVVAVSGLATWLIAPANTIHVGASGVVFGYATYLIARAAYSRRALHLLVGLVVLALYGTTLLFGLFPTTGVSWQAHLFGGVGGVLAARGLDRRPDTRAPALPARRSGLTDPLREGREHPDGAVKRFAAARWVGRTTCPDSTTTTGAARRPRAISAASAPTPASGPASDPWPSRASACCSPS